MSTRRTHNSKRRICTQAINPVADEQLFCPRYVGSPLHKRIPGDFGLTPPSAPRPAKTLCDAIVDRKQDAQRLLSEGGRRGLVSEQQRNGWPQNIWAVTNEGVALEAQLDNEEQGTYHGYPMALNDPLREEVIKRWER